MLDIYKRQYTKKLHIVLRLTVIKGSTHGAKTDSLGSTHCAKIDSSKRVIPCLRIMFKFFSVFPNYPNEQIQNLSFLIQIVFQLQLFFIFVTWIGRTRF